MKLQPAVREALEAALVVAEQNLKLAEAQYELKAAQEREAADHYEAAKQTVDALYGTLEIEPEAEDRYRTFGEG